MNKKMKITTMQLCFLAFAVVLNYVGSNLALALRLPIYLDTIGTVLAGALLGPVFGMIPGFISGVLCFISTDVISLYYTPVQLVTGFLAGLLFQTGMMKKWRFVLGTAVLTLPGTIVSSLITVAVFGGITSSGSSIIVQVLHHLGLNLTASVFAVQVVTDYVDRLMAVAVVLTVIAVMPYEMKQRLTEDRVKMGYRQRKSNGQI